MPATMPSPDPSLDGQDRSWQVVTSVAVTLSIATTVLASRVYTRAVLVKQFGADDWAALMAGAHMLACGIVIALEVKFGLGHHRWVVPDSVQHKYFLTFYLSIVFYNSALLFVKLAFLLQYYRVFAVGRVRRVIVCSGAAILAWSTSQVLVVIFTCTPVRKFWNDEITTGSCIPPTPQWYINAAGNIATDVIIILLPMPVLKSIRLPRPQKLMVMGIFGVGFFTVIVSGVRLKYLGQYQDYTWDNVPASCWSVAEVASGVTCLCLPTLKPLLVRLRPRVFGSAQRSSSYKQSHSPMHGSARSFRWFWHGARHTNSKNRSATAYDPNNYVEVSLPQRSFHTRDESEATYTDAIFDGTNYPPRLVNHSRNASDQSYRFDHGDPDRIAAPTNTYSLYSPYSASSWHKPQSSLGAVRSLADLPPLDLEAGRASLNGSRDELYQSALELDSRSAPRQIHGHTRSISGSTFSRVSGHSRVSGSTTGHSRNVSGSTTGHSRVSGSTTGHSRNVSAASNVSGVSGVSGAGASGISEIPELPETPYDSHDDHNTQDDTGRLATSHSRAWHYMQPLPWGSDGYTASPDPVLRPDALGMQGTVTTVITAANSPGSTGTGTDTPASGEVPMGQITVHCEVRRDSLPWHEL